MADERKDAIAGISPELRQQENRCMAERSWAERWLSSERLAPYLEAGNDDLDVALKLYRWNAEPGQVLMRDISHFEVALRNAYDAVMRECWQGGTHWLLDDESPARRQVVRKRGKADANDVNRKIIDRAAKGLTPGYSAGQLVSSLTLGFWVHLTGRNREAVIWRTCLHHAWPRGTNRTELQDRLDGILRVRNRVAHGERLFDPKREQLSPTRVDADAVRLLGLLCPRAAEYLYPNGVAPIEEFLEKNPAPANVSLLCPQGAETNEAAPSDPQGAENTKE